MPGIGLTWVEIDIDALEYNYRVLREQVGTQVKFLAVVKADAYGHGAIEVSRWLEKWGCDMLGVTTLLEALELRRAGISMPILLFMPLLDDEQMEVALNYDLALTVENGQAAQKLAILAEKKGKKVAVHLKVDTGMGRIGVLPENAPAVAQIIKDSNSLYFEGIYTHFAVVGGDLDYTRKQLARFNAAISAIEALGINIPIRHAANSAAILTLPDAYFDMVRAGSILYGQSNSSNAKPVVKFKETWSLKTQITSVKEVPAGTSIGYGRLYKTRRKTKIAVLPIGFADGYTLDPKLRPKDFIDLIKVVVKEILTYIGYPIGKTIVKIGNKSFQVVGKVAMQSCMLDIGDNEILPGQVAEVLARRTTINPRLAKAYLKDGQIYKIIYPWGEENISIAGNI